MDLNQVTKELDELFTQERMSEVPEFLETHIEQAKKEGAQDILLTLYNECIGFFRETGQYELSIENCHKAIALMDEMGLQDTIPYATTLLNAANAHRAAGLLQESLELYSKVRPIYVAQLKEDDMYFAGLYNNLSLLYQEMGNFEAAKEQLENALHIVAHKPDTQFEVAVTQANLANTCIELRQDDEAKARAEEAIRIFEEIGVDDAHYSAALSALGSLYFMDKEYQNALEVMEKSRECVAKYLGSDNIQYQRLSDNIKIIKEKIAAAENEAKMQEKSEIDAETLEADMQEGTKEKTETQLQETIETVPEIQAQEETAVDSQAEEVIDEMLMQEEESETETTPFTDQEEPKQDATEETQVNDMIAKVMDEIAVEVEESADIFIDTEKSVQDKSYDAYSKKEPRNKMMVEKAVDIEDIDEYLSQEATSNAQKTPISDEQEMPLPDYQEAEQNVQSKEIESGDLHSESTELELESESIALSDSEYLEETEQINADSEEIESQMAILESDGLENIESESITLKSMKSERIESESIASNSPDSEEMEPISPDSEEVEPSSSDSEEVESTEADLEEVQPESIKLEGIETETTASNSSRIEEVEVQSINSDKTESDPGEIEPETTVSKEIEPEDIKSKEIKIETETTVPNSPRIEEAESNNINANGSRPKNIASQELESKSPDLGEPEQNISDSEEIEPAKADSDKTEPENINAQEAEKVFAAEKEMQDQSEDTEYENLTPKISGLELCRRYYEEFGKPMIAEKFHAYESVIAVGLVGKGSDCFGYDDIQSQDHDFGPRFIMWVTRKVYDEIGKELEEAYKELPDSFMGIDRIETYHGKDRAGVMIIEDFYKNVLGFDLIGALLQNNASSSTSNAKNMPIETKLDKENLATIKGWLSIHDYALAAAVNGEIFRDDEGIFTSYRNRLLAYYPKAVWYRKIANTCALFSQNGQYNLPRMRRRGQLVAAEMAKAECMKHAMKLYYLLNRKYAPHDKWLFKGMPENPEMSIDDTDNKMQDVASLIEKISILPVDKAHETELATCIELLAVIFANELEKQNIIGRCDLYLDACTTELVAKSDALLTAIVADTPVTTALSLSIAKVEFEAFDKVKNEGGRASCQNNWPTFKVMRMSQYMTWSEDMLLQYLYEFKANYARGRNMVEEKYARMMESTAPLDYVRFAHKLPPVSDAKKAIIEQIVALQVKWMEEFAAQYPNLAGNARTIHTTEDLPYDTSYETYLRGELGTYSDRMIDLYGRYIVEHARTGKNVAREIMENTIHFYGYSDLESANAKNAKFY